MNDTIRRYQPYVGLLVGTAALLYGAWGLATGQIYVKERRLPGFWVTRAEKPDLYWWNEAIYLGLGVVCIGGGIYVLRGRRDGPAAPG